MTTVAEFMSMDRAAILDRLHFLINGHATESDGFGDILQDPYKSDIFRLFFAAYRQGFDIAHGDSLYPTIMARSECYEEANSAHVATLAKVTHWFSDWKYACDRLEADALLGS